MTPSSSLRPFLFAALFVLSASYSVDDLMELDAALTGGTTAAVEDVPTGATAVNVEQTTESVEVTTDSGCHDNPDYSCAQMKNVCNVTAYQTILRQNCPVTCNMCNDCYDKSDHCEDWNKKGLCTDPAFQDIMKEDCQKTCNACKPGSCYDESDRCADWAAGGLCTNDYFKPEAESLCKKTCNMC